MKVNTQGCCSCRPRRIGRRMKRSGSTLLSSAKPRRSWRQRGGGRWGLTRRSLSPGAYAERGDLLTQRQAQHIWSQRIFCCLVVGRLAASNRWRHSWQHVIESRAATRGQVNAVRAVFKAGITPSRIARQFGISQSDVREVVASESRRAGKGR